MEGIDHITPAEAFALAVKRAGTMSALGRRCDMSQQRISYRIVRGKPCPVDRVLAVERETGISKHLLRPDVYGASPADLAAVGDAAPPVASNSAAVFDRRSA